MSVDRSEVVELLKRVPLFEGCSDSELAEIAAVADVREFPENTELITEGDHAKREFFVIADGRVEVTLRGRQVNELSEGDFFGEIQLLVDTPRLASVTAITPLSAVVITEESFRNVLHSIPSIAVKMVYKLAEMVAYYARQG